ncbi:M24 family metallopeptidase [candidate division KSB1 bacterium]|nr:M24 family metallopeptidase [candidate division KSB1 bacterium]
MQLENIQAALRERKLDGWLFYDFHNHDAIGMRILGLDPKKLTTRRWYYFIPAKGEPTKLNHSIERGRLDNLPGKKLIYLPWQQQHQYLKQILSGAKRIAMQYSPKNAIPYISLVDGGTLELVRSFGVEVVSSADLVSRFEAVLSEDDYQSHLEAARAIYEVKDATFEEIGRRIRAGETPTEVDIQKFMHEKMHALNLLWEDGPIVAVNAHAADPHYEPVEDKCFTINEGDLVLLDLWAKMNRPGTIYADITWMGYVGSVVPQRFAEVFEIVRRARDRAVAFIQERLDEKEIVAGWKVDDACRKVIEDAGYAEYFIHRTGHNIGLEVHGNGTNIDNLETRDERLLQPGILCSDEPGIYLEHENFGIRSEIDIYIKDETHVEVTGERQEQIVPILK